jgi:hypothetical protein
MMSVKMMSVIMLSVVARKFLVILVITQYCVNDSN